jgi:hypothetical protein
LRLIGLHARLHAGKDTAFEFIDNWALVRRQLAQRRAFADPLKISGMRALGFKAIKPDEAAESHWAVRVANQIKETGRVTVTWVDVDGCMLSQTITGRELWQLYGTEAHRADDLGSSFGANFWVDNLLPAGTSSEPLTRAANGEATSLTPLWYKNFEDWRGKRPDIAVVTDVRFPNEATRILKLGGEVWKIDADQRLGPNTDGHASEQPLDDDYVSRVIDNNSDLNNFAAGIEAALAGTTFTLTK